MWRGTILNPSLPVPTYHPEEGFQSHSHSPRRKVVAAKGANNQELHIPFMSGMIPGRSSSSFMNSTFAQSQPLLQRSGTRSGSSCPDPFTEPAAYQEWLGSLGLSQNHLPQPEANSLWPTFTRTSGKHMNTDTSMPDYVTSTCGQFPESDLMHVSGPSLEDDLGAQILKVPITTPTTALGRDAGPSSGAL